MSCVLRILGENFEVDRFISKSMLAPYKKWHKGEPKFALKPEGPKSLNSGLAILVSESNWEDFNSQVKNSLSFLKRNKEKLQYITLTKGIEYAVLDFGITLRIDNDKLLYQTNYFPKELLKICGNLGIGIELSIYSKEMQDIMDERKAASK